MSITSAHLRTQAHSNEPWIDQLAWTIFLLDISVFFFFFPLLPASSRAPMPVTFNYSTASPLCLLKSLHNHVTVTSSGTHTAWASCIFTLTATMARETIARTYSLSPSLFEKRGSKKVDNVYSWSVNGPPISYSHVLPSPLSSSSSSSSHRMQLYLACVTLWARVCASASESCGHMINSGRERRKNVHRTTTTTTVRRKSCSTKKLRAHWNVFYSIRWSFTLINSWTAAV